MTIRSALLTPLPAMLAGLWFAMGSCGTHAETESGGVIRLDETVISGNQELPKVLYIVPWQDPDGMPNIELDPEFTELQVFRRLYPPAYRRELNYYDLLNAAETEE
jgi:hypothetical protein